MIDDEDGEPLGWHDLCWIYGVVIGIPVLMVGVALWLATRGT